jgi:serine/threonine protein phosphatase PrpC
MEDTFVVDKVSKNNNNIAILCVFDGHGGNQVSVFCQDNVVRILQKHLKINPEIEICLRRTYQELDIGCKLFASGCGSTAAMVLISEQDIWASNCGDSETLIAYKNNTCKKISKCHKVENEVERLTKMGANITYGDGCARINRMLNVARSIGDYHLKPYVIADPYVTHLNNKMKSVDYVLVASDGLWDVYDKDNLFVDIDHFRHQYQQENPGSDKKHMIDYIGYELVKKAIMKGSSDNICIILCFL